MFLIQALTRGFVAFFVIMCLGIGGLHVSDGVDTARLAALIDADQVLASVEVMKSSLERTVKGLL